MPATRPRSPLALAQDALVADPQGQPLAVEVLEKRNGEFARQSGELLEGLGIDRPVLGEMREHPAPEIHQRRGAEPQGLAYLARASGTGERLQERARPVRGLPDQRG